MAKVQLKNSRHTGISFTQVGDDLVASVSTSSIGAAPAIHPHAMTDVVGLVDALDSKQDAGGNLDNRYLRIDTDTQGLSSPQLINSRTNLGLGSAALRSVPASGDAGPTEVVLGSDSRLGMGGGGGGIGLREVNMGSITGATPLDLDSEKLVHAYATLTGNVTLSLTNVAGGGVSVVTWVVTQDATGGRVVTYPGGTVFLNGRDGSVNPAANSVSIVTLLTVDGGSTWSAAVADSQPNKYDPIIFNPQGDGDYYFPVFEDMTLEFGSVMKKGTGTLAYARSTGGAFTGVSGTTSVNSGDEIRVTVTSFSSRLSFSIPRSA